MSVFNGHYLLGLAGSAEQVQGMKFCPCLIPLMVRLLGGKANHLTSSSDCFCCLELCPLRVQPSMAEREGGLWISMCELLHALAVMG